MSTTSTAICLPALPAPGTSEARAKPVFSFDVGNVLMDRGAVLDRLAIPERPPVPGAPEFFRDAVRLLGRDRVFVVSKVSEAGEPLVAAWLRDNGFVGADKGRISPANVRFCRERADKGPILAEIRSAAHFDDRAEVHHSTLGNDAMKLRLLFGRGVDDETDRKFLLQLPLYSFVGCDNWGDVRGEVEKVFPALGFVLA